MAYITNYTFKNILEILDKNKWVSFEEYNQTNTTLLSLGKVFNSPDDFVLRYVKQEQIYCHEFENCKRLLSDLKFVEIPSVLIDSDLKYAFKTWQTRNSSKYKNTKEIEEALKLEFKLSEDVVLKWKSYGNSGVSYLKDIDLANLSHKVYSFMRTSIQVYDSLGTEQKAILKMFRDIISENGESQLKDTTVKKFFSLCSLYLTPYIKNLLVDYLRVRFNPELDFNNALFKQLNFQFCSCNRCENPSDYTDNKLMELVASFQFDVKDLEYIPFAEDDKLLITTYFKSSTDT